MADIPGFKDIRLLAQKPIPIAPVAAGFGRPPPGAMIYTMEVSFEDGSVINVPLTQGLHDKLRERMATQPGVGLEERMAARGAVVLSGEQKKPVREQLLPLDASGQQIVEALQTVSGQNDSTTSEDGTTTPRLPAPSQLERELAELERTDPAVGAAARNLDRVKQDIIRKGRKA